MEQNILQQEYFKIISYIRNKWSRDGNAVFTLGSCLFGSVKLTKNTEPDKQKCSGYGIGFDSCSEFSFTDESMGKNIIIFEANLSSSVYIDNKNKDILILGQGLRKDLTINNMKKQDEKEV